VIPSYSEGFCFAALEACALNIPVISSDMGALKETVSNKHLKLKHLSETQVWLDFALACEYIPKEVVDDFNKRAEEVGRLLNHMIQNPEKYK